MEQIMETLETLADKDPLLRPLKRAKGKLPSRVKKRKKR